MSLRQNYPKAQIPDSHYFLTLARGENARTLAVRPWVLFGLGGFGLLLGSWYLAATLYLVFRDDMLASLMSRQAQLQYAYEDRLAAMRGELDRVTSRQLLDQDSFEGKMHQLLSRQAQLEGRASMVATLAEVVTGRDATGSLPRATGEAKSGEARAKAVVRAATTPVLGASATGFAPLEIPPAFPPLTAPAKPRPEASEAGPAANPRSSVIEAPVAQQLGGVAAALDRSEAQQVNTLALLQAPAAAGASRLKGALADVGLSAEKLAAPAKTSAMGGPFIPLRVDPNGSPFEREASRLQGALQQLAQLRAVLPYVPLRQPLPGALEVTSGFGYRVDPFLGRPALHAGVDLREEYGAPIRATAAGVVVTAKMSGGYGNMVEIDHGNGLSTRYGHMSSILVSEGQKVDVGAVLGRIGSTGRSTGPHLHYEVRVNDNAVDPTRFLRAGQKLAARD